MNNEQEDLIQLSQEKNTLEKGRSIHYLWPKNIISVDRSCYKIIESLILSSILYLSQSVLTCNGEKLLELSIVTYYTLHVRQLVFFKTDSKSNESKKTK